MNLDNDDTSVKKKCKTRYLIDGQEILSDKCADKIRKEYRKNIDNLLSKFVVKFAEIIKRRDVVPLNYRKLDASHQSLQKIFLPTFARIATNSQMSQVNYILT